MLNLKRYRLSANLTQQELADATGIDRSTLVRYENGSRTPPLETIKLLAEYFDISVDDLVGAKSPTSTPPTDDELWNLRESLRRDPKRRMLFDAAAGVNEKDIQTAVRLLDALKGNEEDGAD